MLKPTPKGRKLPGRNDRELPEKMSENCGQDACWGLPLGIFRNEFKRDGRHSGEHQPSLMKAYPASVLNSCKGITTEIRKKEGQ